MSGKRRRLCVSDLDDLFLGDRITTGICGGPRASACEDGTCSRRSSIVTVIVVIVAVVTTISRRLDQSPSVIVVIICRHGVDRRRRDSPRRSRAASILSRDGGSRGDVAHAIDRDVVWRRTKGQFGLGSVLDLEGLGAFVGLSNAGHGHGVRDRGGEARTDGPGRRRGRRHGDRLLAAVLLDREDLGSIAVAVAQRSGRTAPLHKLLSLDFLAFQFKLATLKVSPFLATAAVAVAGAAARHCRIALVAHVPVRRGRCGHTRPRTSEVMAQIPKRTAKARRILRSRSSTYNGTMGYVRGR